ncbi:MAG: 7,8-didemethyl-8-hydroxy-5-deazariboflavin synthase subunit CofG [Methanobacteriaceae archaeon]
MNTASHCTNHNKTNNYITFSKNIFIPLTEICRNYCGYCTFKKEIDDPTAIILKNKSDIIKTLQESEKYGCKEALFAFGEQADSEELVKANLSKNNYSNMLEYIYDICNTTLNQTKLLPHTNGGIFSYDELKTLKEVNVSMGLMLETSSPRLMGEEAHKNSPGKDPKLRLQTIKDAGKLKIPFTTGILIGIGETKEEIAKSLLDIRKIQDKYGHIQEIIIQNFRAKPGIPMENQKEPSLIDIIKTVATAKLIFPDLSIQVPPNLNFETAQIFLLTGVDDWGGVSPVSKDYVNPEAPWPEIQHLKDLTEQCGFKLKERLAIYDKYINKDYLNPRLLSKTEELVKLIE